MTHPPPPSAGSGLGRAVLGLVAISLAIGASWLILQHTALRRQLADLRTERDLAATACRIAESQLAERTLLAEHLINDLGRRLARREDLTRLRIAALAAPGPGRTETRAIAVWDPDREVGLLTVEQLPAIADTQDYQIWLTDLAHPAPVNGGVFRPDADGRAAIAFKGDQPVRNIQSFAVSVEKKGGVPEPAGTFVLLGQAQ